MTCSLHWATVSLLWRPSATPDTSTANIGNVTSLLRAAVGSHRGPHALHSPQMANTPCFKPEPALRWWRDTQPEHAGGSPFCDCANGGYCSSVQSFQRWMRHNNIGTECTGRAVPGFDVWEADRLAVKAKVHPAVWWPEWFTVGVETVDSE